jgi:uncharacterized protein (DUF1800 family)
MKAVIRAILTDYEARSPELIGNQGWGKLKEPLLRISQVARALHPTSNANPPIWRIQNTDTEMAQSVYRSPTVFNFFEPDYVYPGAIAQAGLLSPEFQITTENTTILTANLFKRAIIDNNGFTATSDVRLNLATEQALAPNLDALLDHLNRVLMAGQLTPAMRTSIKQAFATPTVITDPARRARGAVYLIASSPQFATQK